MSKVFIFDIDGTLTPSRQKITKPFQQFFEKWIEKNPFYLVTGSDLPKVHEQMNYLDIEAQAIFTCCGNEMWIPDPHIVNISAYQVYENKFELTRKLKNLLDVILMASPYPHRYGNHIEDRGSMVNFSIVGRDCTQEQREEFFEWDNKHQERKKIATAIKEKFPKLDAVIGGQISIDIYPKGNDKSQILEHIINKNVVSHKEDEFIFFGDRIEGGGNDYPLAKLMETKKNCKVHSVENYRKTWWHLMRYDLENK